MTDAKRALDNLPENPDLEVGEEVEPEHDLNVNEFEEVDEEDYEDE